MTDRLNVTHARDLPDGTTVEYEDATWTAYPEADIAGSRIRWHSETGLAGDRGMDAMLDDGARVTGRDDEALAGYLAVMKAAGR
jgi:hypothetical protein